MLFNCLLFSAEVLLNCLLVCKSVAQFPTFLQKCCCTTVYFTSWERCVQSESQSKRDSVVVGAFPNMGAISVRWNLYINLASGIDCGHSPLSEKPAKMRMRMSNKFWIEIQEIRKFRLWSKSNQVKSPQIKLVNYILIWLQVLDWGHRPVSVN